MEEAAKLPNDLTILAFFYIAILYTTLGENPAAALSATMVEKAILHCRAFLIIATIASFTYTYLIITFT